MVISMTGFGRGEATENGTSATVEIKSLNSRYLDLSIRLPQRLQDKELALKELAQQTVNRGKLNVVVHITDSEKVGPNIIVDEDKVKGYAKILNEMREVAGISEALSIQDIMNFSDVFTTREEDDKVLEQKWVLVKIAAKEAFNSLLEMRMREGEQLKSDLLSRIDFITACLKTISASSAGRGDDVRNKLKERIISLIGDEKIDKERLELEIAIIADKMDITEEVVRLHSHLKFFVEAVEQPEPAGRRLNFLTQEINRELNTIGSKANDSDIAQYVVKAKEALEQIREQVQNVE